jgi:hypothetical protein
MAQTKTKPKSKAKAPSKRPSNSRRPSSSRNRASSSRSNSKSSSSKPAPVVTMSKATDKATNAVGNAAKKATVPLVASGAAIVGAAGGMALGARQARRNNRHNLAKAAKGVGTLGTQMGRLASEIHQARESGNGKHRSPVEVVLEGLTARRSDRR